MIFKVPFQLISALESVMVYNDGLDWKHIPSMKTGVQSLKDVCS